MTIFRLQRFCRTHSDWIITVFLTILLLGILFAILSYIDSPPKKPVESVNLSHDYSENTFSSGIYETKPPDPQYPPPAKEQRTFYRTYHVDNFSYNLVWSSRNIERNPAIGPHIFTVEVYNSRNASVLMDTNEAEALTIGCIGVDSPYRTQTVQPKVIEFTPYEKKKLEFAIDVSCLYLGTADGQYFWRIY